MEWLTALVEFILHPDQELAILLHDYGTWVYAILFAVLFCETGLVVTPFLPGDSLLFVAGALWASSGMDVTTLCATLFVAVLCGDNCNYWIGRLIGYELLQHHATSRWINPRALARTHGFYRQHGGKTIILARFVPIVRTFAPFVAGLGRMKYPRFLAFSIAGAMLWIGLLVPLGYWFGNVPWVRANFGLVAIAIVIASVTPIAVGAVKHWMRSTRRR